MSGKRTRRYCKSCITLYPIEYFNGGDRICASCKGVTMLKKDLPKMRECLGIECEGKALENRMFLSRSKLNKMCSTCKGSDFARFHA